MEIFTYKLPGRPSGKCGIEVYGNRKKSIVVVTELSDNPGMSVCNAFEYLILQVANVYNLDPATISWYEHWGKWSIKNGDSYNRKKEDWSKVRFDWDGHEASNPIWETIQKEELDAAIACLKI